MRLAIPSDALVVLIGAAGCGKSTLAARHFKPTQIVSSDECRALVSDDAEDSGASSDAFELMHFIVDKRLKRGRLTVVDATNVRAEKRAALLTIAARRRRPAVALVLDLPEEVCQARNKARVGRRVPVAAIRAHRKQLRMALPGLGDEGFAAVHVLHAPEEIDGLEVVLVG